MQEMNEGALLDWDDEIKKFTSCRYNKIIVTGPQRSGTRFLTDVLATDLNLVPFFEPQDGLEFGNIMTGVWQGPKLSHMIHKLELTDSLVVWVLRNTAEILASEKRIKWGSADKERNQLPVEYRDGILCEQRYRYWKEYQRNSIPNWVEVHYESMKGHSLWVSMEDRNKIGGFEPTRTRL